MTNKPGSVQPAIQPAIQAADARQAADGVARNRLILPVLLAAIFMGQFDLFVVNVAAPGLAVDLGAGPAALELVVGGYAFTYAGALITGGRLGDLFGHRAAFLAGVGSFTMASLLCGLARSPAELVGARLLQGLTAAVMVPQVLAMITATFGPAERARALSWFGVTMGIGAVAGQVLGGGLLVVDLLGLGWRVIFLVNLPIGLITLALAAKLLPSTRPAGKARLDPVGMVAVSGALALALAPLVLGRSAGWPPWAWTSLTLAGPALAGAVWWERRLQQRGGQPLLDLGLFRIAAFSRGLLVNVGVFSSFNGFLFALTLVLQSGLGLTPLRAGLTFCPLGVAFAAAPIAGRRQVPRFGARVITVGTAVAGAGLGGLLIVLAALGQDVTAPMLVGPMVLVGMGNGVALPALIAGVLTDVEPGRAGAAAGVLTTAQQFAGAAGIAVLGGVFFQVLGSRDDLAGHVDALRWQVALSLLIALSGSLISRKLPRPDRPARG
jgi:MFS family permease